MFPTRSDRSNRQGRSLCKANVRFVSFGGIFLPFPSKDSSSSERRIRPSNFQVEGQVNRSRWWLRGHFKTKVSIQHARFRLRRPGPSQRGSTGTPSRCLLPKV